METTEGGQWVSSLSNQLTLAAKAYFSSTLLPLAYDVWWLPSDARADPPGFNSLVFNQKDQYAGYYPGYPQIPNTHR